MRDYPSTARSLADPTALARRRAMLCPDDPFVQYANSLRRDGAEVPDFDPINGNGAARMLFLLEKPGPMTDFSKTGRPGSGLISPDNNDPSAEATFVFLQGSGIDRSKVVIWNLIPRWNGTRKIVPEERREGLSQLGVLLGLLPRLQGVVLVGRTAARAASDVRQLGLKVRCSAHPSPLVRARYRLQWDQIPQIWRAAALECGAIA